MFTFAVITVSLFFIVLFAGLFLNLFQVYRRYDARGDISFITGRPVELEDLQYCRF